jgi:hypothetical protein
MSYETKSMLVNLFRKCIDAEVSVEAIRQRICKSLTLSFRQVFDSIDWLNRGFITKTEVKRVID